MIDATPWHLAALPPRYEHTSTLLARAARRGPIRSAALGAWRAMWRDRPRAAFHLTKHLRRAGRRLRPWERRLVAAFLYAMVRGHRAWRTVLEIDERAHAALWLGWLVWQGLDPSVAGTVRGGLEPVRIDLASAFDEVLAGCLAALPDDEARLALTLSVDDPVAQRFAANLGTAAAGFVASANRRAPLDLRVARARTSVASVRDALAEDGVVASPHPASPGALRLEGRFDVRRHALYAAGLIEIQDAGSQWLTDQAAARPGEIVVDFCAGGGGKTLGLADRLRGEGELWAWDVRAERLEDLRTRAERAQLPERLLRVGRLPAPGTADLVLVDAPCTGSGTLRREPCLRWRVRDDRVAACAALQQTVLRQAWPLVRPGGRLVYATCSVFAAENEATVATFVAATPEATLERSARRLPQDDDTDGFFVAVLDRT